MGFFCGTRTFCISPNTKHYNKTSFRKDLEKMYFLATCISETNTLMAFLYILHQLRRDGTQSDGNAHFNSAPRFCPKSAKPCTMTTLQPPWMPKLLKPSFRSSTPAQIPAKETSQPQGFRTTVTREKDLLQTEIMNTSCHQHHSQGHDQRVFPPWLILAYGKHCWFLLLSFSPWTQGRDKLLTLESSSRTGLVLESAR